MKKLTVYGLLLIAFLLSGCVMRMSSRDVDRVDQEIKGNRGILFGETPDIVETEKKKTRKVYDLEIELFSAYDIEKSKKEKTTPLEAEEEKVSYAPVAEGNKGYMQKNDIGEERKEGPAEKEGTVVRFKDISVKETPQVNYQGQGKTYVVVKGDTLQKISDRMYGTTKKWKKIYDANKNILKSPNLISPGQKLVIPID